MKTLPMILAASLLANAGLVATVTLRRSSDAASGTASTWVGTSSGARVVATSEAGRSLAAAFNNDDPAALRDFLRAAGLPEDVVRSLVIMRIHIHDSAFWTERNKAQQQLNAQIKDALGDDRYAAYTRSQNYDYQQLQAAATRFNLPAGTADRVYSLRNDVTAGAQQINDNTSLSREQKKQALIALANATRDQVRSALGDEVAAAFFANNGMSWLKPLGEGQVVRLSDGSGNGWSASLPSGSK